MFFFFAYKETRNIDILWQQGNRRYRISFLTLVYVLSIVKNAKSIVKEHLDVFITERFIEKTVFFFVWDPVKTFRRSHQKCCIKEGIHKNSTVFTGKHLFSSLFSPVLESLQLYQKETPTQVFSCEYCEHSTFIQNTSGRLLLEVDSENTSQWWLNFSLQEE